MQRILHYTRKVIYQSDASYDDLLQVSISMSLHQQHLRFLLAEIYKSTGILNPQFMWSYFKYREVSYNLRQGLVFFIPPVRSTIYGTNSVHFLGSLIWNKLPNLVKSSRSISEFKNVINKIRNIDCGCMICRRQQTLSQFPHNSCSSLCSLGSCSHQSFDSLQHPIGWFLYDLLECQECGVSCILTQGGCITLCITSLFTLYKHFVIFVSWFLLAISLVCTPTLNKVINKINK